MTTATITTTITASPLAPASTGTELIALLHLASPALPIGAFSYSQGLEAAIDAGLVHDADSARGWIAAGLDVAARGEAVFLARQYRNWQAADTAALSDCNDELLALRESAELRQETEQMGWSLARLLDELAWGPESARAVLRAIRPLSLPTAYAYALQSAGVTLREGLQAWLFAWTENQVGAALKAVPLGQVAGQRILFGLRGDIAAGAARAAITDINEASTFAPLLGILSARHETQYSRLFRS